MTSSLPALYANWIEECLDGAVPDETLATCERCPMCEPVASSHAGTAAFDSRTKCCTYTPNLPSFLAGLVLRDASDERAFGRQSLLRRIEARDGVSPLGVAPPRDAEVLYNDRKSERFGVDRTLRCPHYVEPDGRCGIWAHRNAICSTWFCKHVRGAIGKSFWASIESLLVEVEEALATWCALELGVGAEAVARRVASRIGPLVALRRAAGAALFDEAEFGPWRGRVDAYFVRCAELVAPLSWSDVRRLGGARVTALERSARHRFERLRHPEIPDALRVGSFEVVRMSATGGLVRTYSMYDLIDLPHGLLAQLHRFDGRATREILAEIARDEGKPVDDATLTMLVDFGVLESA